MPSKASVKPVVFLKAYDIIHRAVEEGVSYGIRRTFKYDDQPMGCEALFAKRDTLIDAVMADLCEVLEFSDGDA